MRFATRCAVSCVALLLLVGSVGAQVADKKALTMEGARLVLGVAEAHAGKLGAGGSIAVVDDGGHLLAFVRLGNSFPAGANVSIGKARTAAMFRKPTREFEELINNGRYTMTALPDFTPLQGGVPILCDGVVVGAIGVSGAANAQQDEEIAMAGATALAAPSVGGSQTSGDVMRLTQADPTQMAASTDGAAGPMERYLVNRTKDGVAILGYDPVAYFKEGRPEKGSPKFQSTYAGATYNFVSEANKALFDGNPDKYAPEFGGYCGYAASINRVSPVDPDFWQILDGRLVLQHNQRALDAWNKDVPGNLAKADANWPGLVQRFGTGPKALVNVNRKGVAILGYDPVAYFTDHKPVKGKGEFESAYDGALYHFASKEHREMFENEPTKYVPQFGGYCAYAASINKVSPINPQFWQIEDGRLLLQHTRKAYDLFNQDTQGNLNKADANWPGLVERFGK
jgi:glc operon protein GlcG